MRGHNQSRAALLHHEHMLNGRCGVPEVGLRTPQTRREIVVVAHNGIKFDSPFLLSECYRARLPLDIFAKLKYVETLPMVRAIDGQLYGGCMNLQCILLHLGERGEGTSLRAHRVLDDAIVLRDVVNNIAHRLGVSTSCLLSVFSHELDLGASIAHLSSMI